MAVTGLTYGLKLIVFMYSRLVLPEYGPTSTWNDCEVCVPSTGSVAVTVTSADSP